MKPGTRGRLAHRQLALLLALSVLALSVLALSVVARPAAALATSYLAPATLDLAALLPDPPAAGSPEDIADFKAVLQVQKTRTPATIAAAQADAQVSVFRFADILGPAFNAGQLPVTSAFFRTVGRDSTAAGARAKAVWKRPRPPQASSRVKPVLDVTSNDSYPSGHAMYGCTGGKIVAAVLLQIPVFQADFNAARDETRRALGLEPLP